MLPLEGVKVLDLGTVLMAPYAGQWLGDLGADVIKVEPPSGDSSRRTGPAAEPDMSALFLALNRNKRSVVLDLKTFEGRDALFRLADGADILLHNNRPQKMKALGLGPDALLARNPRLVYACLHGFGEAGPYGGRPAYDDVIQGMCGLADLMARQSGTPRYVPSLLADKLSGLTGVIAILAALSKRDRLGGGGYVEIPMFESMVAFTVLEHLYGHYFDPPMGDTVYPRAMTPDRRPFATADGFICALPYTDRHWSKLLQICGRPDLVSDPRFADIGARTRNIAEVYGELAGILVKRPTAEWLHILGELEIPCARVASIDDLLEDPHLRAVGFFTNLPQSGSRTMRLPGVPVLFDGKRPPVRRPPRLGEHTVEVLQNLPVAQPTHGHATSQRP
jgi:crotonobetainyl-CoA:carnitine CoA-transferase CaiB-like acyl-CoA transferase